MMAVFLGGTLLPTPPEKCGHFLLVRGMGITRDVAIELLSYDRETGVFVWNNRGLKHFKSLRSQKIWNSRYAGKAAGCIWTRKNGYQHVLIRIFNTLYPAHRIAWLIEYGYMPDFQIDHINRNATDNRICNLRDGSTINYVNKVMQTNNSSGFNGVCWHSQCKKWRAYYYRHGKQTHIGLFDKKEDAARASKEYRDSKGFAEGHGEKRNET